MKHIHSIRSYIKATLQLIALSSFSNSDRRPTNFMNNANICHCCIPLLLPLLYMCTNENCKRVADTTGETCRLPQFGKSEEIGINGTNQDGGFCSSQG